MKPDFTIIGAGIGGLTMALALKQKGFQATIYESAEEIRPVGAGIVMANNAMQIFKKFGIHNKIEQSGSKVSVMNITDHQLKNISTIDLSKYENRYGVHNVAIHRGDLQKILAEEIGFENLMLSKRLKHIEKTPSLRLTFEDNTTVDSEWLIGADGIRSVVREQLFEKSEIRSAEQVCWRGVAALDLPEKYNHSACESWGKGKRFGFVRISEQKIYWYAVANESLVKGNKVDLLDLFSEFHNDILRIISGTPQQNVHFSEIVDLKPITKWQNGNVCLIGDAAHATTPNMGQGACQAIEDAYTIGRLTDSAGKAEDVFLQYEKLRVKKAHAIVSKSWTLGKVAHIENGAAAWLRNTLMKSIPASVNSKQLHSVFDISYV